MKVSFTFRHMKHSESLISYGEEKIQKLLKFEMKPSWVEIVVDVQRHLKQVELKVVGKGMRFVAKAESVDAYQALDDAIEKLGRQMFKKKSITQNHKHARRSKKYILDHYVEASLPTNYLLENKKKAA